MISIGIDIDDLSQEFALSNQQVDALKATLSQALANRFAYLWDTQAARSLKSSRSIYRRNIVVGRMNNSTTFVQLTGTIPNMIEQGASAFDIKVGFSKSMKRKITKKGGWYLTIPLRQATPSALGESQAFASVMPEEIYKIVKSLQPKITMPGRTVQKGQSLMNDQIPKQYQIPKIRSKITENLGTLTKQQAEQYIHKSNIFVGLQKTQKTYRSATQSGYVNFRRASSNSAENAWIHRGMRARNFAQQALDSLNVTHEVDMAADSFLANQGF